MEQEEKVKWLLSILPHPYNEWGISKDEFNFVNGWNSFRHELLRRAGVEKNGGENG